MTPLRWLWRWCPCEACWRKRHPRPTVYQRICRHMEQLWLKGYCFGVYADGLILVANARTKWHISQNIGAIYTTGEDWREPIGHDVFDIWGTDFGEVPIILERDVPEPGWRFVRLKDYPARDQARVKTATECEMWGREQALIAEREMRYQLAKAALRDSAREAAFFGVDVNKTNASL